MTENYTFSPDGRYVVTCDRNGRVCFWMCNGPEVDRLLGIYTAAYEVEAIYWVDDKYVLLADKDEPSGRWHLYRLQLEGEW